MTKTNHSQCDYLEGYSEGFQSGAMREREQIYKAIYKHFRLFDGGINRTHKISESQLITLIKTEALR